MPRIPRGQLAGDAYHVLNRGNGVAVIFHGVAGLESSLRPRRRPRNTPDKWPLPLFFTLARYIPHHGRFPSMDSHRTWPTH